MQSEITNLIIGSCTRTDSSWAIVRDGVVAEFSIVSGDTPVKTFENDVLRVDTHRATLSINFDESMKAIVAESGAHGCSPWTQNIYLCIPKRDAKMSGRKTLTHLGVYNDGGDSGELWDIGVGNETLDACIIVKDNETNKLLKQKEGKYIIDDPKFLREIVRNSPTRLFKSKFASIIVRQKIPLEGEDEIEGPHTHLLSPIIKSGKHFDVPIPNDMIPVIQVDPFGSVIDGNGDFYRWQGFEKDQFQTFLQKYGDQDYISQKRQIKQKITDCLKNDDHHEIIKEYSEESKRDLIRITLAQLVCDDSTNDKVRRRAFKILEEIKSINLRGLKRWVQHMAPEIQN